MTSAFRQDEERILVVAPTARDAQLSQSLFDQAGLHCVICLDDAAFQAALERGAGAVLLTEEALAQAYGPILVEVLANQLVWSDLPVIVLAGSGSGYLLRASLMHQLGNVLVLERPVGTQTLVNAVRMALRSRRRQYHTRLVTEIGRLLASGYAEPERLATVAALCVPQLADCCLIATVAGTRLRATTVAVADELQGVAEQLRTLDIALPDHEPALTPAGVTTLLETRLRAAGAHIYAVLPLLVQERTLGALGIAILQPGRELSPHDRQVAQGVADRLALALERARLYYGEQHSRAAAEAAVRERDALFALISHDLNNPLTVVLGQMALLKKQLLAGTAPQERVVRGIARAEQAARQMQSQIEELLDVARLTSGRPIQVQREPTDLVTLIARAVADAQQTTERHQIAIQVASSELVVSLDPMRMRRAFDNLLSNAVKYSPGGGAITVTLAVEQRDDARWAVIIIQDQGMGIPAAELSQIFGRFQRASNTAATTRGTGLGLASVRQIVEHHGGRVTVASVVNGGSCFTIHLPLDTA